MNSRKPYIVLACLFFLLTAALIWYTAAAAPSALPMRFTESSPYPEKEQLLPYTSLAEHPVNLNTASVEELQTLPGIGASKASAIFEYVSREGPLSSVEQLLEVKGIGEKILETLRPYVILE